MTGKKTIVELISAEKIQQRVRELGTLITSDFAKTDKMIVICVLKGAFMFTADLVRSIEVPCHIEFIRASSYGNSIQSSGKVCITGTIDIEGHDILVVEDIIDTGLTISRINEEFRKCNPASLKICTLLEKPAVRKHPVTIDYLGFSVPNRFVVGYGIDYAGKYRQLPFLGTLE
ncbi:hypoxanthine phosphoribosyltransferase [Prosthecochloris sp. SCSIO W1101]|uniref:hypoxanthine phosphoribosyltransferase n=1 Tax=Prosthecochloris sp. SCSIO W1101 TaxID=2992242 RepID=UPI00223E3238|nr:hypoxanthine phosphoribosyltransferase [Prosthecochloris sp. SCSIO W1101]UZJ42121.1 hypoxanthine phosphoribosyltransferase [Prosthecochloris sp. SCSIO W1101]